MSNPSEDAGIAAAKANGGTSTMMSLQEAFDEGFLLLKNYLEGRLEEFADEMTAEIERRQQPMAAIVAEFPVMRYRGVWREAAVYAAGDVTTRHGVLWHAGKASVGEAPGAGPTSWTMMTKTPKGGT